MAGIALKIGRARILIRHDPPQDKNGLVVFPFMKIVFPANQGRP